MAIGSLAEAVQKRLSPRDEIPDDGRGALNFKLVSSLWRYRRRLPLT